MTDNQLTHAIIGAAIEVHRALGPGLLEAVYEECLARELVVREIPFERQKPIPLVYRDLKLECGYRIDLLVKKRVVVEIKAVELLPAVVEPIMLTYLRLSGCKIGLLINFHSAVLRDGIRRFVWHYEQGEREDAEAQSTLRGAEKI
ncbi:MAG: GxxExxY protein [Chloroflexi bacterium]|nr:GxxExxY protein [Chloroflexota bacterium]